MKPILKLLTWQLGLPSRQLLSRDVLRCWWDFAGETSATSSLKVRKSIKVLISQLLRIWRTLISRRWTGWRIVSTFILRGHGMARFLPCLQMQIKLLSGHFNPLLNYSLFRCCMETPEVIKVLASMFSFNDVMIESWLCDVVFMDICFLCLSHCLHCLLHSVIVLILCHILPDNL